MHISNLTGPSSRRPNVIVAALIKAPEDWSQLRHDLSGVAEVEVCDCLESLRSIVRRKAVALVVLEPTDTLDRSTQSAVIEMRREHPTLPIVAYCDFAPADMHLLVPLARAGIDDVVLRGFDDLPTVVRRLTSGQDDASGQAAARSLADLAELVPRTIYPMLEWCLQNPSAEGRVERVAQAIGVGRRTLVNRCRSASLPGPSELLTWSRLLAAAHLLEDAARSVEQVAHLLRFPSAAAFRATCKRYTGRRPLDLRGEHGYDYVLELIAEAVSVNRIFLAS